MTTISRGRHGFRASVLLLMISAGLPSVVSAQGTQEATDAIRKADCRLAAQALTTGRPEPLFDWARAFLPFCEVSGGATLASLWQRAPGDSAGLSELFAMSAQVRDQRVLDAVLSVASDPSAGWWRRTTAMRVMASYVRPRLVLAPDDIRARGDSALRHSTVGHASQVEGSVPLEANWSERVKLLLTQLASADPDAEVRHSAQFIAELLQPAWTR